MLGITPGCPKMGMGVFTRIFNNDALLISSICLAVAEMPVFFLYWWVRHPPVEVILNISFTDSSAPN